MEVAEKQSRWIQVIKPERINMNDYIPGLKKSIKTENISQAKTFLEKIYSRPEHEKLEALQILALASDKTAFELLSFLTGKNQHDPQIHDRVIQLITDRAHLNSDFALILLDNTDTSAIMHIVPLLKHILTKETNPELLSKIIRTAGKIQIKEMVADIAEFIFYDNIDLKAETVKALEQIGTSTAFEKLVHASKTSKNDQNILDAIEVLEDKNSKRVIVSGQEAVDTNSDKYPVKFDQLASKDIEKQFEALAFFSDKGSKTSLALLKHLKDKDLNQNHDLTINIMRLIARNTPLEAVNDLFDIINTKNIDNTIKFAAYSALRAFPELNSAALAVNGLSESSMFVRMAAIKTLDRNLSDFVASEIKNKIESGTKKGELLAQSILDARAKNIIEFLMISDTFAYMASNYFTRAASIQVLDTFIEILEKRKLKSTAKKYRELRETKRARQKKQFVIISSSDEILDTYGKLIYSCGFSHLSFQRSQDAFETIVSQKPDAIICDLILNDMTGLDFAKEARKIYPQEKVSIILSTMQKELNKARIQKTSDYLGINGIYEFPPKPAQIKSWVK